MVLATIRNYREDIILERIAEYGTEKIGIVEYADPENLEEMNIIVDGKTVTKEIHESDNYYEAGDTVRLYHYTEYPSRYIFKYEDFDSIAHLIGLLISVIFLSPILLFIIRK